MENEIEEFDYKQYSLDKLKTWIEDAVQCGATPTEIYSVIVETIQEDIDYHKKNLEHTTKLMDVPGKKAKEKINTEGPSILTGNALDLTHRL